MILLSLSLILTQTALILASYGCLNESGNAVDYWVAIKAAASSTYYYYDVNSNTDIFTISPYNVSQVINGAIMSTVYQVYAFSNGTDVALGMYSDDPPGDYNPSSTYAHAKGVLFTDTTQGFWLVQSKPNWPGVLNFTLGTDAAIPFPDDDYAQSLMCISINASTANIIATNLMIDRPYLYSTYITSTIANQLPELNDWLNKNHNSVITNSTTFIKSIGGYDFTQFAKSQKYGEDLWDDLVAPFYKTEMNVDTWISGSGGRMSSMCGPDADSIVKYDIYQVYNITMSNGKTWLNTKDHSKWGAARVNFNSQNYASCVGDNNRMCSQEKRGGGALCTTIDSNLWNAFNNTIASVESCFEHNPCGGSGSQCYWCPLLSPTTPPSLSPSISPTTLRPTNNNTDDITNNSNEDYVNSSNYVVTESTIITVFLGIGIIIGMYIISLRKQSKLDKNYSGTSLYEVFFTTILSSINFISSILFAVAVLNMNYTMHWIFYTILSIRLIVGMLAIYLFNNIILIERSESSSLYIVLIKLLMIVDNFFVKYLPLNKGNNDTIENSQINNYTYICTGSSFILYIIIIGTSLYYLSSKQSTPFVAIYVTLILSLIQLLYLCICGIFSNYSSNDGNILQTLINSLTPGRTKENIHLKKNVVSTPAFTISPVHDNNESKSRINSTTAPSLIRISVDEKGVNKNLTKLVYSENNLSNSPSGNSLL